MGALLKARYTKSTGLWSSYHRLFTEQRFHTGRSKPRRPGATTPAQCRASLGKKRADTLFPNSRAGAQRLFLGVVVVGWE